MLFSVIIPLYNKADVILRTLASVANQTFRDFELIVIDDGSTDAGWDIVSEYVKTFDVPVKLLRQENAGVSATRNIGAAIARGKFLAMLDGDDVWEPFHLSDVYEVYQKFPAAKVISTAYASVNGCCGRKRKKRKCKIVPFNVFDYPCGGYPVCSDTFTVDRLYFMKIGGYDTKYKYFEDRELYYRIADDIGCFYANLRVSAYYYHDAADSAHTHGTRGFAECGFLQMVARRILEGTASSKMCDCVVTFAKSAIRGGIVRGRWDSVEDLEASFPEIFERIHLMHIVDWREHKLIIRTIYTMEWMAAHIVMAIKSAYRVLVGQ